MIVLVDTNVLLDVIMKREPFDAAAARVWKVVEEKRISGFASVISYSNIFYLARKELGAAGARDSLRLIRNVFELAPTDASVLDWALAATSPDFEDALQAAAARAAGADLRHFRPLNLPAVTAEELLAMI